ncbi:hypothetical protein [Streptomyces turgidiscabies]|uniref:Secreted protein n=1 Tax=Streptomyces turgidiscabies TaxID=85558 RepID=A0ABU0RKR8_9ACTN|nr:hypothetical protein [Streptomyces turgidiscabies]MDQ0932588.1 hypothetical protein [Streptomyces turgidiscabies]
MKFRPLSLVVALTIAGTGTLLAGTPANAASHKTCAVDQGSVYDICFDADGDKFIVNDIRSDGMRAVVKWKAVDGSGRVGQCADTDGAFNAPKVCAYDFREGPNTYVSFVGFVQDGPRGAPDFISMTYNGYISPR